MGHGRELSSFFLNSFRKTNHWVYNNKKVVGLKKGKSLIFRGGEPTYIFQGSEIYWYFEVVRLYLIFRDMDLICRYFEAGSILLIFPGEKRVSILYVLPHLRLYNLLI